MTDTELREEIRKRIRQIGTQKEAAKRWGFSDQFINDIIKGRRNITKKLLAAIGYKRTVIYEEETEE